VQTVAHTVWLLTLIVIVSACFPTAHSQERVIVGGPRNVDLMAGADALLAGDAEEGVRLTVAGLGYAATRSDRLTGMSNLCAGYILLARFDDALEQCDKVLSEDAEHWRALANRALIYVLKGSYDKAAKDLDRAEELAPAAPSIKNVRELLRDRVNPVEPIIIMDDRRTSEGGDSD
jgi:tetratricopeptide (TPR) repeat protein